MWLTGTLTQTANTTNVHSHISYVLSQGMMVLGVKKDNTVNSPPPRHRFPLHPTAMEPLCWYTV